MIFPAKQLSSVILLFLCLQFVGTIPLNHHNFGVTNVSAVNEQGNFDSINITNVEYESSTSGRVPSILVGDGQISEIWDDIQSYANPSFGTNGKVQSVYGVETIYFLLTYDSSITWVSLQWDSDFTGENAIPMEKDDDMWVMGNTEYTTVSGDGYSAGQGISPYIYADDQNDIRYEVVEKDNFRQIEIQRPLQTGDTTGKDVQFDSNTDYTVMYASNQFHAVDNQIVKHTFTISDTSYGSPVTQQTRPSIDNETFIIKYLNMALAGTILFMVVVLLPIQVFFRRA